MLHNYRDLLKSFHSREVKYVIIGGVAAITHGVPRATFDLDVYIEPTLENADRVLKAMVDARFGTALLTTPERLIKHSITVCDDRLPLDVMTKVPGLRFETAWKNRELIQTNDMEFYIVSRRDLLRSKRAADRTIDHQDIAALTGKPYGDIDS